MGDEHPLDLRVGQWREKLEEYRAVAERAAEFDALVEQRKKDIPGLLGLLDSFLEGSIDLERLRSEFDTRTKTDWVKFGFKGLSGAMFLNKLVKHMPDQEELTQRLKTALALPRSPDEGYERMRAFDDYLESQIETKLVTRAQLQPSRVPFFVGAWWHLRAVEVWPIYYTTARDALRKGTGYSPSDNAVASYFAFREHYLALAAELDLSTWEFEQLCAWLEEPPETDKNGNGPITTAPDRVWLLLPGSGAESWDEFYEAGIAAIGWDYLGDLKQYKEQEDFRKAIADHRESDRQPINAAMACYQFAYELKQGDVIYAKKGRNKIIGRGIIESDYKFDTSRASKKHVRRVKWDKRGEWVPRERPLVSKTLTEIGRYPGLVRDIERALGDEPRGVDPPIVGAYDLDMAADEIFMARSEIEELLALLRRRKNVILQGPPGTGKSFIASRLAWLALGGKDAERLATVQFHQSYSYEDFVQGYRPTEAGGFERRDGPFMRFCNLALQDQEQDYVLIIDEINRGNLSKILGELMMLIEPDKRDGQWSTHLAYSAEDEEPFYVPPNLLIIGTMNTADRSLALVDYALRRRFAFVDVEPAFVNPQFQKELEAAGVGASLREQIVSRLAELNRQIAGDRSLGRGFMIGHSYFCQRLDSETPGEEWLEKIARTEIEPLLREYWFDSEEKAERAVTVLLESD